VDKKDYPMAFVMNVGKGRVFHSPLGHDIKAFQPSHARTFPPRPPRGPRATADA